jgi:hypothetical protein
MLRRASTLVVVIAALGAIAIPAHGATTSTTFALTAGTLSISTPSSKVLGTAATTGSTISAQLGTVTVTDERGTTLGSWTATVSSSDFTTGGATANETIAKASVDYWSGSATTSGTGTFTPGQLLAANKQALSASRTAYAATVLVGNNTAAWNPTVILNIPASAVAGDYTGTITHSVA